jgi:hypothetical protein
MDRYVTDPAAAGKQPTHFQRNPPGQRPVGCFLPPRRIGPYDPDRDTSLAPRKIRRGGTCGEAQGISWKEDLFRVSYVFC